MQSRGADFDAVEPIKAFWAKCGEQSNPLAWLPLHRTDIEQSVSFPSDSAGGSVSNLPSTSIQGKLEKQPSRTTPKRNFTAVLQLFNESAAARCVRSWTEHSNGKVEAKLFESSSIVSAADISTKQLLKLQLECLAGASPGEVRVEAVSCSRIFEILFGVASNGGAYSQGAYGRLAAWQSLAAVDGAGPNASFDEVYKTAKESNWYSITSKAKWFNNIAWDFVIVCLRPDKRHIAVLAATDED